MTVTVTLCHSCRPDDDRLLRATRAALAGGAAQVRSVECMSGCTRPATVAIRAPGKTAYLFGDMEPQDAPLIAAFVRHYVESPDGSFEDARILGALRFRALARIPGA